MVKGIYKIPGEDVVLSISLDILKEHGMINSLKMFTKLVNMRARSEENLWRISQKRLKRIVSKSKNIKIDIIGRKSNEKLEGDVYCILCGEKMEEELNRTLNGGTVVLGYVCPHCGYSSDPIRRIPLRYVFRYVQHPSGRQSF